MCPAPRGGCPRRARAHGSAVAPGASPLSTFDIPKSRTRTRSLPPSVLSIITLWVPVYGVEGLIKALTAVASILTAVVLWPLLPKILALPSPGMSVAGSLVLD